MELLVAIPMLAIVGLAISYSLGSSSRLTATQIARVKCQVAAGNILTLIKAASSTASLTTFAANVTGGELNKTSAAHPDGNLKLNAVAEVLENTDGTHGSIAPLLRIRVTAPAFDVRSEIKTYFNY